MRLLTIHRNCLFAGPIGDRYTYLGKLKAKATLNLKDLGAETYRERGEPEKIYILETKILQIWILKNIIKFISRMMMYRRKKKKKKKITTIE